MNWLSSWLRRLPFALTDVSWANGFQLMRVSYFGLAWWEVWDWGRPDVKGEYPYVYGSQVQRYLNITRQARCSYMGLSKHKAMLRRVRH